MSVPDQQRKVRKARGVSSKVSPKLEQKGEALIPVHSRFSGRISWPPGSLTKSSITGLCEMSEKEIGPLTAPHFAKECVLSEGSRFVRSARVECRSLFDRDVKVPGHVPRRVRNGTGANGPRGIYESRARQLCEPNRRARSVNDSSDMPTV